MSDSNLNEKKKDGDLRRRGNLRHDDTGQYPAACIYITDCKVTPCSFNDVELRNGSYLIEGIGDVCRSPFHTSDLHLCLQR